jgi:hypothetical protein
MTLPASGAISLNNVNVELGLTATAQIGLNDAAVRDLFGVASGVITMADGYGKLHGMVATGGTITTDGDYKVHTFNSSGTFTVTTQGSNPVADFLVIAGGGGAGNSIDAGANGTGGGGAGGYRTSYGTSGANSSAEAALTLSEAAYTVSVGAGGQAGACG